MDKSKNHSPDNRFGGSFKTGDLVYAPLGTLPVVGTVVHTDPVTGRYLVRFSAVQQDWYSEEALKPYDA